MIFDAPVAIVNNGLRHCHSFVADGKLYMTGPNGMVGGDQTDDYTIISTTDLINWVTEFSTTNRDYIPPIAKLTLSNGDTGYFGTYYFADDASGTVSQPFYYSWQPTLGDPGQRVWNLIAPTTNTGGDYYFMASLPHPPIQRDGYTYIMAWAEPTEAVRLSLFPWPTGTWPTNHIRIYRISDADLAAGNEFTKYAEIPFDSLGANDIHVSETSWIEKEDGSVDMLVRAWRDPGTSYPDSATFLVTSEDLLTWSLPVFFQNGNPDRFFRDYDGTIYVGAPERGSIERHWDTASVGVAKTFLLESADDGDTYSERQEISTLQNWYAGYPYPIRFKDRIVYVYSQGTAGKTFPDGMHQVYLKSTTSDPLTILLDNSVNDKQVEATANGENVTNRGIWITSDPTKATVFMGELVFFKDGPVDLVFDYAGYLSTLTVDHTNDKTMFTNIDSVSTEVYKAYKNKIFSHDGVNYFRGVKDGDAVSVDAIGLTAY